MFGINFPRKLESAEHYKPRPEQQMRAKIQDLFPYRSQIQHRWISIRTRGGCKAPHAPHPPRPPKILLHAPKAQSAARLINQRTETHDWNNARIEQKGARKQARALSETGAGSPQPPWPRRSPVRPPRSREGGRRGRAATDRPAHSHIPLQGFLSQAFYPTLIQE